MMMTFDEAVSHYFDAAPAPGVLPQPSEILSEFHDDGCWALANVNGLLALVDVSGSVLCLERDN
jgi:hypothetical protein